MTLETNKEVIAAKGGFIRCYIMEVQAFGLSTHNKPDDSFLL